MKKLMTSTDHIFDRVFFLQLLASNLLIPLNPKEHAASKLMFHLEKSTHDLAPNCFP